jgi:hypothetical protein
MSESIRIVLIAGAVATWFLWGMAQDFTPCPDKPACWQRIEFTAGVPIQNTDPAGRADWVGKPGASLPHEPPSGGKGEAAGATRQAGETPATPAPGVKDQVKEPGNG